MINLKNYARLAEQKKYGYFNKINEDNVPNIDLPSFDNTNKDAKPNLVNAKLVMSGEVTNSEYSDEWNQLVDSMEANKIKYANSNTEIKCNVIITRDGKPFAEIEYYIFHGKVARENGTVYISAPDTMSISAKDNTQQKTNQEIKSNNSNTGKALLKIANEVSKKIEDLFPTDTRESDFFKGFKGQTMLNDDRDVEAAAEFDQWYGKYIKPTVTQMQADADALPEETIPETLVRSVCIKNAADIVSAVETIKSKMTGNFDFDDVVNWRIMDFTGMPKNYTVDTDI